MEDIRKYIENLDLKTRLHDEWAPHEGVKDEEKFREIMLTGFDKIVSLKDKYKNKPMLVMGLGPSLLDIDKEKYKDFLKITVNNFQRVPNFFTGDFVPDFWCAANGYDYLKEPYSICLENKIKAFVTIAKKTELEMLFDDCGVDEDLTLPWIWENEIFQIMLAKKYNLSRTYTKCNTVTNHAIAFSLWLGCNPIHVTGFDLSHYNALKNTGNTHAGYTCEEKMENHKTLGPVDGLNALDDARERIQIMHDLKYFCSIAYKNNIEIHNLSHKENKLPYNLSFKV